MSILYNAAAAVATTFANGYNTTTVAMSSTAGMPTTVANLLDSFTNMVNRTATNLDTFTTTANQDLGMGLHSITGTARASIQNLTNNTANNLNHLTTAATQNLNNLSGTVNENLNQLGGIARKGLIGTFVGGVPIVGGGILLSFWSQAKSAAKQSAAVVAQALAQENLTKDIRNLTANMKTGLVGLGGLVALTQIKPAVESVTSVIKSLNTPRIIPSTKKEIRQPFELY
jgi:hypothetical protein